MNIIEIEKKLNILVESIDNDNFIYSLLEAYDFRKSDISRAKQSALNKLDTDGSLTIKKKLYFLQTTNDVHLEIDNLKNTILDKKDKPRFVIVTDYETILSYDTKTDDSLDIPILELDRHHDFFLPWVGMEKSQYLAENPADIKAAAKMAKLYDEILKVNALESTEDRHYLNVFLTRLLFCYFAEDTNIFHEGIFTQSIESHTKKDGSDLDNYLERLFVILNTEQRAKNTPAYLNKFPYVNGGLFRDNHPIPPFTAKARKILIEVGTLKWSEINPDIFGSMVQAVITPEHRAGLGMHYTSVPNIMKVISPLFLDDLYEEFDKCFENVKKLKELIQRIANIKIFDPACGSANFLIIAYKKLRELEIAILQRLDVLLAPQISIDFSQIRLDNFYGIEIDDFPHEVAILSMWLVEHQMNMKFYEALGRTSPTLPLKAGGNIVQGNATRLDWEVVCPKSDGDEVYILGNPPYLGARLQSKEQKEDIKLVFKESVEYKDSDYIACWFIKGAEYILDSNACYAFVSTNSITQGEQVSYCWKRILEKNLEISFAYKPFKWVNNAKGNAGVIVTIIGVRNKINKQKIIFNKNLKYVVNNITPYITAGNNIFIHKRNSSLSQFQKMNIGSMARDGGYLILSDDEKNDLIEKYNEVEKIIKPLFGSAEFIKGTKRWAIWIENNDLKFAETIPEIKERIDKVYRFRVESKAKTTNDYSSIPHKFAQRCFSNTSPIIVPSTSSERREYIPIGFLDKGSVVTNSANVVYDSEVWLMGILTSKMHMTWMRAVAGRLEERYRYSSTLVYNTFPFPDISQKQKDAITELVYNILDEREKHSEKTLAQLYDPDKMPSELLDAHHELDLAIEQCYRMKPFKSDEERLEYLFGLYEKMANKEN